MLNYLYLFQLFLICDLLYFVKGFSQPAQRYSEPEFPLFNISSWKSAGKLELLHEEDERPVFNLSELATNEASREFKSEIWIIIILCALLCLALRHANDFYHGQAITLVNEGVWNGRFKHRGVEQKFLSRVEEDFQSMFQKIKAGEKDAEIRRLRQSQDS
ncbi:unnamed protein product, partial [Mesorhabditis spiculigera]